MSAGRSLCIRTLEVASVAGFAAAAGELALRIWSLPWQATEIVTVGGGAFLGFLLADVASGTVHWFCDTFFHDDTPVIGVAFIRPFREHHADPEAITRHGFFEVNGNNCLALLPLLAAVVVLGEPSEGGALPWLFGQCVTLFFALATFGTNQIHKWAHQHRPPPAVRWLQATGLILSPARHARHHRAPYRQSFCITAGWLDPWIDRCRVFERIERAVGRSGRDEGPPRRVLSP